MTLNEYQSFAARGIHDATLEREPIVGFALGLAGEAGEVVDDIKKRIFHGREVPMEHTIEELGDVLWYTANIATQCGVSLEEVIDKNVSKLLERYPDKYTDTSEQTTGKGFYRGQRVVFAQRGPHIAMYTEADNKFIKFLSKEEKKHYGFDLKEELRKQYGTPPVTGDSGSPPWE